MMERFVDMFKRAIKKASGIETVNIFLSINGIIPNVNASSGIVPAKLMLARKIYLVFYKLRPTEKKMDERKIPTVNTTTPVKKYISRIINLEK